MPSYRPLALVRCTLAAALLLAAHTAAAAPASPSDDADRFIDGSKPFVTPRDRRVDVVDLRAAIAIDPPARAVRGEATWRVCRRSPDPGLALELDAVDLTITDIAWLAPAAQSVAPPAAGAPLRLVLPFAAGDACGDLRLRWSARPRRGMYFVGPDADEPRRIAHLWTQGETQEARHWLPCPDDPDERFTWTLQVEVPAPWRAVSNGEPTGSTPGGKGTRVFGYRMETPHPAYLISVFAGPFEEVEHGTVDGVRLSSWALPADVARARAVGAELAAMVTFFHSLPGVRYPHGRYSQVWVDGFTAGGMENVTVSTLSRRALGDERSDLDWTPDGLLAHELAHQWFGDTVTCRSWADIWLNEGFATYYQKLWSRKRFGEERFAEELAGAREAALGTEGDHPRAVVQDRFDDPGELFDGHSYSRGAWVLHMLREELGAAVFDRGVALYLQRHRFASVESDDLRRAWEEVSGRSLRAFFARWLQQPGLPSLKARAQWKNGQLELAVEQVQPSDGRRPLFDLDVDVDVAARVGGEATRHVLALRGKRATLTVAMAEPPALVGFDPQAKLLAAWKLEVDAALLLGALDPRRHPDLRWRAAKAMEAGLDQRRVVEALIATVAGDKARHVRAAAARTLGFGYRDQVRAALVAAAADGEAMVRAAAVAALGRLYDRESIGLLQRLAAGDPSAAVTAAALDALVRVDRGAARAAATKALARPSWRDAIAIAALGALAQLGDAADAKVMLAAVQPGQPRARREGAALALARWALRVEPQREAARLALEPMLQAESPRLRAAATMALGALGEPAAGAALRAAAQRELFAHLARMMSKTAAGLGKTLPVEQRLRQLEATVQELERRLEDKRAATPSRSEGGGDKRAPPPGK